MGDHGDCMMISAHHRPPVQGPERRFPLTEDPLSIFNTAIRLLMFSRLLMLDSKDKATDDSNLLIDEPKGYI